MNIIKNKSSVGTYEIRINEDDNKSLSLIWGGNGDLYWILNNLEFDVFENDPMYDTFCITKKDYALYSLFKELYDDLIDGRIYLPEQHMNTNIEDLTEEEQEEVAEFNAMQIEHTKETNREIQLSSRYKQLVKDNIITWYSDEEIKDIAEIVRISKQEDSILIEFIRQSTKDDMGFTRIPGDYSVRFRTSGSTYTPCDAVFTRHFLKMLEYDFDAPQQIHIEEWCYNQKQLMKKQ